MIKIGVINEEDNPVNDVPQAQAAAQAAARALNAAGGIDGRQIQLVQCNDKVDPNLALACARQMVAQHVLYVTGGSVVDDSIIPVLKAAGIPMIGFVTPDTLGTTASNAYQPAALATDAYAMAAHYAACQGKKLALIAVDLPIARAFVAQINASLKRSGTSLTQTIYVPPTTEDYGPFLAQAKSGGAQALIVAFGSAAAGQVMTTAEQSEPFSMYLSEDQQVRSAFLSNLGKTGAAKVVVASPYPPISDPAMAKFRADLAAEEKAGDKNAAPDTMSYQAVTAWLSMYILKELAKSGNVFTPAALIKALNSAHDINMLGLAPPWTPTAKVPNQGPRVSTTDMYIIGVRNGVPTKLVPNPVSLADAERCKF